MSRAAHSKDDSSYLCRGTVSRDCRPLLRDCRPFLRDCRPFFSKNNSTCTPYEQGKPLYIREDTVYVHGKRVSAYS